MIPSVISDPSKVKKRKRINKTRMLPTQTMDPSLKEAIASQASFSLRLYSHLLSFPDFRNSNYAFSPLSIHSVLSLLTAGSTGPTLQQLLSFLGSNAASELSTLHSHVSNILITDRSDDGGPCLRYACGVWVDDATSLKNSFKEIAGSAYKAVGYPVPFRFKPEECRDQINKWVEQATARNIKNLLGPKSVTSDTRMLLGNALYFNATWKQKFSSHSTRTSTFNLTDGTSIEVPFMADNGAYRYVSVYDEFKVLKMPYEQNKDWSEFSFYIFLPNTLDGLLNLSMKLSSEPNFLDCHIPTERVQVRYFRIPKFKISMQTHFSDVLKNQGLVLPFTMTGDFSEMVDSPEVFEYYVSEIAQKCSVGVNEVGTEAAAASVLILRGGGSLAMLNPFDFVADHPFLFLIREDKSGVVLFAGHVLNPLLA